MNKHLVHLVLVALAVILASGCKVHVRASASGDAKTKSEKTKTSISDASASTNSKTVGQSNTKASANSRTRATVHGKGKGKVKYSTKVSTGVGRAKKPKNHRFKYKVSYKNEFSGKYKVGAKGRVESSVSTKDRVSSDGSAAVADESKVKNRGRDDRRHPIDDNAANQRKQRGKKVQEETPEANVPTGDRRHVVRYTIDDAAAGTRAHRNTTAEEIAEEDAQELPPPPEEPPANEFGYESPVYGCFEGEVMFIEAGSKKLPTDYANYDVASVLYACEWDIPTRSWSTGFPGLADKFEWFAIRYSGAFHIQEAGTYTFRINSDDGTKLYIDGQLVVDNDGVHPPRDKNGSVELTAGDHELVLEYFQGPRYHIALQVFVTPPGGEEGIFSVRAE